MHAPEKVGVWPKCVCRPRRAPHLADFIVSADATHGRRVRWKYTSFVPSLIDGSAVFARSESQVGLPPRGILVFFVVVVDKVGVYPREGLSKLPFF